MPDKVTAKSVYKRVAVTVYMSQSLSERIVKGYAKALLNGYAGTKQTFLTQLLEKSLTATKE